MSNITNLDDHREHFTINTGDAVHVIPKSVFEHIADGTMDVEELTDYEYIIPVIVREWLERPELTVGLNPD